MRTLTRRVAAAIIAGGALSAAGIGPASATGPTISTYPSSPVDAAATVTIGGTGCPASSPVSIYLWNTIGGDSPIYDSTTANGTGAFSRGIALAGRISAGADVGVAASCTASYDHTVASSPVFFQVAMPTSHVSIVAPRRLTYGTPTLVEVDNDNAPGATTLTVDGHALSVLAGDGWAQHHYRLPRLAIGTHHLHATYDPDASGAPTASADRSIQVTKIHPSLALWLSPSTMRRGSTTAARVTLNQTGAAPRTGKVVLEKNGRIVATGQIRTADNGVRIFAVRIRKAGTYHLTAVFLGTSTLARTTSPTRTLTVHR